MTQIENAVLVQGATLDDIERIVKRVVAEQLRNFQPPQPQKVVVTKKTPTYIKRKEAAKLLSVSLTTLE